MKIIDNTDNINYVYYNIDFDNINLMHKLSKLNREDELWLVNIIRNLPNSLVTDFNLKNCEYKIDEYLKLRYLSRAEKIFLLSGVSVLLNENIYLYNIQNSMSKETMEIYINLFKSYDNINIICNDGRTVSAVFKNIFERSNTVC